MARTILGMMGLPGAGKTSGMENLLDRVDYPFEGLTMSEVAGDVYDQANSEGVEEYFTDTFIMEAKSNDVWASIEIDPTTEKVDELGDWVDAVLTVDNVFFATKAVDYIQREYSEESIIVVDGVRTTADVSVLKEHFTMELLYIHTPFSVRLERLRSRGRGEEESMAAEDLVYRDDQELSWGVDEILSEEDVTYVYNNYDSLAEYQFNLDETVNNILNL